MVDLQNEKKTSCKTLSLPIIALVVAITSLALNIMMISAYGSSETQMQTSSYYIKSIQQLNLDSDGFFESPRRSIDQRMPLDSIDGECASLMPSVQQQNPSVEYPFGGYEGHRLGIKIGPGESVWTAFDRSLHINSIDALGGAAREELIFNLVAELESQVGRKLDIVQAGEQFTLDLRWESTPDGTTVPFGERAPEGRVDEPLNVAPNPEYDGTPHTVNPQLGTFALEVTPGVYEK